MIFAIAKFSESSILLRFSAHGMNISRLFFRVVFMPRQISSGFAPYTSGRIGISKFVPSSAPVIQSYCYSLVRSKRSPVAKKAEI